MAYDNTAFSVTLMFMGSYVVEITDAVANGLLVPEAGCMRSVSNKDAIRLWLVVSWAGFGNQTTMIGITWGTKNEGSLLYIRPARLA